MTESHFQQPPDTWRLRGNYCGLRIKLLNLKITHSWTFTWRTDASWLNEATSCWILQIIPVYSHYRVDHWKSVYMDKNRHRHHLMWQKCSAVETTMTSPRNAVQSWKRDGPFPVAALSAKWHLSSNKAEEQNLLLLRPRALNTPNKSTPRKLYTSISGLAAFIAEILLQSWKGTTVCSSTYCSACSLPRQGWFILTSGI